MAQNKNQTKQEEKGEQKKSESQGNSMIAVIRIKGRIGVKRKMAEGLKRLGLNTKYSCVILKNTKDKVGMLKRLRDYVAYGDISEDDFKELLEKRSKAVNGNEKKPSADEVIKGFKQGKRLKDMNVQPVFRLHPPRKGIESKQRYPKRELGYHGNKINELLKRMV